MEDLPTQRGGILGEERQLLDDLTATAVAGGDENRPPRCEHHVRADVVDLSREAVRSACQLPARSARRPVAPKDHLLAPRHSDTIPHVEPADPCGDRLVRVGTLRPRHGVRDVDERFRGEVTVDRDIHDSPEEVHVDTPAQVEERPSSHGPVFDDAYQAVLLGHEDATVREEVEIGREAQVGSDGRDRETVFEPHLPATLVGEVLEPGRQGGVGPDPQAASVNLHTAAPAPAPTNSTASTASTITFHPSERMNDTYPPFLSGDARPRFSVRRRAADAALSTVRLGSFPCQRRFGNPTPTNSARFSVDTRQEWPSSRSKRRTTSSD